jgi:hypothetical protein
MASREWVKEHRELQYLRSAAGCHPRRRLSRAALRRRRRYASLGWQKYCTITGIGHGRN